MDDKARMRVDFEDVQDNHEQRRAWNQQDLENIDLYYDGEKVEISQKMIEDWAFVGLSNTDFILNGIDWVAHEEKMEKGNE